MAACPHYCTDLDVTCGGGRGCPLVVHSWADLKSVQVLHNDSITRNVSEYMLVLAVCQESPQLSPLWLQSGCWKISTNAFGKILVLFLQHSRGNDVHFSFVHTYVMHFLCSLYVMPTVHVLSVAFVQMYLM